MKRFALIGHPVAGSLSPRLFTAAYGGRYPYELVDGATFEEAWGTFLRDYHGVNVTAPYKQDAFAQVDFYSDKAGLCRAVNLVVKTPDGLYGDNTDVDGVLGALPQEETFRGVLVVGTGGAARAAIAAARLRGCEKIWVAGRTPAHVESLSRDMNCLGISLEEMTSLAPDLLLYTLPASAPVPAGLPCKGAVVMEAEYRRPQLTECACRCYIPGRQWLLHQAIAGYQLFTGEKPDTKSIISCL